MAFVAFADRHGNSHLVSTAFVVSLCRRAAAETGPGYVTVAQGYTREVSIYELDDLNLRALDQQLRCVDVAVTWQSEKEPARPRFVTAEEYEAAGPR